MESLPLVENGISRFRIQVASTALPAEKRAASELQETLAKITGCKIPLVTNAGPIEPPCVVVGPHPALAQCDLVPGLPGPANLGEESFFLKTGNDVLVIAGGRPRGTLYGVYYFLSEIVGVRYLWVDFTHLPARESVIVPELDEIHRPDFEYRLVTDLEGLDPDFSVKQYMNLNPFAEPEHGGSYKLSTAHLTHTFYQLANPKRLFEDHPDFFSMIDGERVWRYGQLCLTNPALVAHAKRRVVEWARAEPDVRSFGIVQNDWMGYCQCEQCRAVDEREGSHAGTLIHFVNQLAEALEATFPGEGKRLHTIAYTYTERPPLHVRPRANVMVVLCNMHPICLAHGVEECPHNARYRDNLEGWLAITPNVLVWHYIVDFKHLLLPFPNFRSIARDMAYYKRVGVQGVLGQTAIQPGAVTEFQALHFYFVGRLLWDATQDWRALAADFIDHYYGPAAAPLKTYFFRLQETTADPDTHMHLYSSLEAGYLTPAFLAGVEPLFEEALALAREAGNPAYVAHVEKARLSWDYAYLLQPVAWQVWPLENVIGPRDIEKRQAVLARFKEGVKRFHVGVGGEENALPKFVARQETLTRKHSLTALFDVAPTVMALLGELVQLGRDHQDDAGIVSIFDLAQPVVNLGVDPRIVAGYFQEKNLFGFSPRNIWTRKVNESELEAFLHPPLPQADFSGIPGSILEQFGINLPDQPGEPPASNPGTEE